MTMQFIPLNGAPIDATRYPGLLVAFDKPKLPTMPGYVTLAAGPTAKYPIGIVLPEWYARELVAPYERAAEAKAASKIHRFARLIKTAFYISVIAAVVVGGAVLAFLWGISQ